MWNPFKKKQPEQVAITNPDLTFGNTWHRVAGNSHTGARWAEVFIEGVLMQNYDGTGEKPRVVFSAGTDVFIRTEPWLREYYALSVPLQDPRPGTVAEDTSVEKEFFERLDRR